MLVYQRVLSGATSKYLQVQVLRPVFSHQEGLRSLSSGGNVLSCEELCRLKDEIPEIPGVQRKFS